MREASSQPQVPQVQITFPVENQCPGARRKSRQRKWVDSRMVTPAGFSMVKADSVAEEFPMATETWETLCRGRHCKHSRLTQTGTEMVGKTQLCRLSMCSWGSQILSLGPQLTLSAFTTERRGRVRGDRAYVYALPVYLNLP